MMVEYSFAEEIEDVKQDEAYEVDGEVANIYKIIFFLIPWWYIKQMNHLEYLYYFSLQWL